MFSTKVVFTTPEGFQLAANISDAGTSNSNGGQVPTPDEALALVAKELLIKRGEAERGDFEQFTFHVERKDIS